MLLLILFVGLTRWGPVDLTELRQAPCIRPDCWQFVQQEILFEDKSIREAFRGSSNGQLTFRP